MVEEIQDKENTQDQWRMAAQIADATKTATGSPKDTFQSARTTKIEAKQGHSEYIDLNALSGTFWYYQNGNKYTPEGIADKLCQKGITNVVLSFQQMSQLTQDGTFNNASIFSWYQTQKPTYAPNGFLKPFLDELKNKNVSITMAFGGANIGSSSFALPSGADGKTCATKFYKYATGLGITNFDFDVEDSGAAEALLQSNQKAFMEQLSTNVRNNGGTMSVTLGAGVADKDLSSYSPYYMDLLGSTNSQTGKSIFTDVNFMCYADAGDERNLMDEDTGYYEYYLKKALDQMKGNTSDKSDLTFPSTVHIGFQDGSNYVNSKGKVSGSSGTNAAVQYKKLIKDFNTNYGSGKNAMQLGSPFFWPAEKVSAKEDERYQPQKYTQCAYSNWNFNDVNGESNGVRIAGNFEQDFINEMNSSSNKKPLLNTSLPVAPNTDIVVPKKNTQSLTLNETYVNSNSTSDNVNDPSQTLSTQKAPINYNEPTQAQLDADQAKKEEILNQILLAGN